MSPDRTGPDFLTSSLPPSSRPGHQLCTVASEDPVEVRRRPGRPSLVAAAGVPPGVVDWAVTGTAATGVAVGSLAALPVGIAALVI
ncbi:hypothetical protein [Rhodococcus sp. W8901]|uniref:hypothetical protein n=1 Tax=Rhodococcus sp. W8901 TaxID=2742603 RepID=UPI001583F482|nr:hypothetical protein [Rhodococcus sp. W8901]QKT10624.1 hypothetical protein HUN07_07735 [Rhodococcus sp. W8901]